MKNRPWLLIIIGLGAIVLAIAVIRPEVQRLMAYFQAEIEPDIWFWDELAMRLEAALFLLVGAFGILGLRRWGVILLWLSAFLLGTYWSGVGYHREALGVLALHLPFVIVPLLYWKRLTWKT